MKCPCCRTCGISQALPTVPSGADGRRGRGVPEELEAVGVTEDDVQPGIEVGQATALAQEQLGATLEQAGLLRILGEDRVLLRKWSHALRKSYKAFRLNCHRSSLLQ